MLRMLRSWPGLLALALPLALALGPAPARAAVDDPAGPGAAVSTAEAAPDEHPAGAADHAAEPDILKPDVPLAFWTLIVFVLLMLLLWRFAWGPLSKALHDREHHMTETLRQAEHARAEGQRLLAEHHRLMEQANQQAQSILDAARRDAESSAEQVRRTAHEEAEATLDRARREIDSARDQALIDIWSRTADLAVTVAGQVLDRELSPEDHRRLTEQAVAQLPAAPQGPGNSQGQLA